jgi:hypothetical protein
MQTVRPYRTTGETLIRQGKSGVFTSRLARPAARGNAGAIVMGQG